MIKLLLASFLLAGVTYNYEPHTLPKKIEWKTNVKDDNLVIQSTLKLKKWKIQKIKNIYITASHRFFHDFEHSKCDIDNFGTLHIRIINKHMLRDKRYFYMATPTNFGRYFRLSNTLYVIHEVFDNPEYLAHELAHYFYDECNIKFPNDLEEHRRVYKFQQLYRERDWNGRSR